MTLYGITPDGTVVKRQTKAGYSYGVVRDGKLVRCAFTMDAALHFAGRPGDVIVGLTPANLIGNEATYVAIWKGVPVCYPRCYACDNPGVGRHPIYPTMPAKRPSRYVPACRTRHAQKDMP